MKELLLRRHGEVVSPAYAAYNGDPSWAGKSTSVERSDGEVSGVVKRYEKHAEASSEVHALGLIKNTFSESIEYTGIAAHVRGLIFFLGIVGAAISVGLGKMYLTDLIARGLQTTFDQVLAFFACVIVGFGVYFFVATLRLEFFRPEDEPLIFDRKHRRVYRLFREVQPGVTGLFKRWPMHAAEYQWDLIDAEHNAVLTTTGSTVMRYHSLVFIVRKSQTDPTIIDSFQVGNTVQLGELSVAPLWEHIRRFMEENGPHLPPTESLSTSRPPRTLWESLVEVAPVGPAYRRTWTNLPVLMVVYHLFFPICVPFFFLWGVFNWMSHKTATRIRWPQEVCEAVQG
jgi:hypothetical protein